MRLIFRLYIKDVALTFLGCFLALIAMEFFLADGALGTQNEFTVLMSIFFIHVIQIASFGLNDINWLTTLPLKRKNIVLAHLFLRILLLVSCISLMIIFSVFSDGGRGQWEQYWHSLVIMLSKAQANFQSSFDWILMGLATTWIILTIPSKQKAHLSLKESYPKFYYAFLLIIGTAFFVSLSIHDDYRTFWIGFILCCIIFKALSLYQGMRLPKYYLPVAFVLPLLPFVCNYWMFDLYNAQTFLLKGKIKSSEMKLINPSDIAKGILSNGNLSMLDYYFHLKLPPLVQMEQTTFQDLSRLLYKKKELSQIWPLYPTTLWNKDKLLFMFSLVEEKRDKYALGVKAFVSANYDKLIKIPLSFDDTIDLLDHDKPDIVKFGLRKLRYFQGPIDLSKIYAHLASDDDEIKKEALITLSLLTGEHLGYNFYAQWKSGQEQLLQLTVKDFKCEGSEFLKGENVSDWILNRCSRFFFYNGAVSTATPLQLIDSIGMINRSDEFAWITRQVSKFLDDEKQNKIKARLPAGE